MHETGNLQSCYQIDADRSVQQPVWPLFFPSANEQPRTCRERLLKEAQRGQMQRTNPHEAAYSKATCAVPSQNSAWRAGQWQTFWQIMQGVPLESWAGQCARPQLYGSGLYGCTKEHLAMGLNFSQQQHYHDQAHTMQQLNHRRPQQCAVEHLGLASVRCTAIGAHQAEGRLQCSRVPVLHSCAHRETGLSQDIGHSGCRPWEDVELPIKGTPSGAWYQQEGAAKHMIKPQAVKPVELPFRRQREHAQMLQPHSTALPELPLWPQPIPHRPQKLDSTGFGKGASPWELGELESSSLVKPKAIRIPQPLLSRDCSTLQPFPSFQPSAFTESQLGATSQSRPPESEPIFSPEPLPPGVSSVPSSGQSRPRAAGMGDKETPAHTPSSANHKVGIESGVGSAARGVSTASAVRQKLVAARNRIAATLQEGEQQHHTTASKGDEGARKRGRVTEDILLPLDFPSLVPKKLRKCRPTIGKESVSVAKLDTSTEAPKRNPSLRKRAAYSDSEYSGTKSAPGVLPGSEKGGRASRRNLRMPLKLKECRVYLDTDFNDEGAARLQVGRKRQQSRVPTSSAPNSHPSKGFCMTGRLPRWGSKLQRTGATKKSLGRSERHVEDSGSLPGSSAAHSPPESNPRMLPNGVKTVAEPVQDEPPPCISKAVRHSDGGLAEERPVSMAQLTSAEGIEQLPSKDSQMGQESFEREHKAVENADSARLKEANKGPGANHSSPPLWIIDYSTKMNSTIQDGCLPSTSLSQSDNLSSSHQSLQGMDFVAQLVADLDTAEAEVQSSRLSATQSGGGSEAGEDLNKAAANTLDSSEAADNAPEKRRQAPPDVLLCGAEQAALLNLPEEGSQELQEGVVVSRLAILNCAQAEKIHKEQTEEGFVRTAEPCSEEHELAASLAMIATLRPKRVPGCNRLNHPPFQRFMRMIRNNSHKFEADGRILRLKQYMASDANCAMMEAVIASLSVNTRVEVLYIQNFEMGMYNNQLKLLTEVLKKKRIWALNIGENFNISLDAWQQFTDELAETAVSFMYVSEHHLLRTDLKVQMRDAIRENRRKLPPLDPAVTARISNMWWNPPKPNRARR